MLPDNHDGANFSFYLEVIMVVAGDFKNGITFDDGQGNVLQVIEFQHVKPGKGAAFVRTKLKNVISGAVTEKTFNPTDKFENAYIERKDMQYSYDDGDLYHFMDTETWEETLIMNPVFNSMTLNPAAVNLFAAILLRRPLLQ